MIDLDDPRFNRTFELPASPDAGRSSSFKIKYTDYGYRNEAHPEEENVLLFFPPLMASRLLHVTKDELAKKHKIRIISLDRPGIGGTDPSPPDKRLDLWQVPALLAHLGIQHVSIACHSGGTIWALDMILHHPELLHPSRPYLAIGAPWILPSHTGSPTFSLVQVLPAGLIGQMDKLVTLVNNHILPLVGTSAALSVGVSQPSVAEDVKFEEEMSPKIMDRVYAEGVQGISAEAILLMQKANGSAGWSDWGDYDKLVPRLASALRAAHRRLRIDVFYAETDSLIGNAGSKGQKWLDKCFNAQGNEDAIEYRSRVVEGTDHNTVWNLKWGAAQEMFEVIGRAENASPEL
ncbi:hypothetical protein BR93DRAFT_942658 [Coniochaeta sp. PMI_546]|nr:hypothetical protein BR93DRAFT_942658 [Coniochaeta sp. PMI_546]